jgi:NOL1/NOP2/sun family putative RNA methylase
MPELMPNHAKIEFKDEFVKRYSKLTDFETFKKYCLSFPRRSIRVNTLKTTVEEIKKRLEKDWKLTQVPWCEYGFWIEGERRDVGNLTEHAIGYIYIQEAASMIPPIALDPQPGEVVLDMCASPGSKTTQIAQLMQNKGTLIANDFTGIRVQPLAINLQRCGITNVIITVMHGQRFKQIQFDKILVDAPCSGTGTIRKSLKTLLMWNPGMIKRLAHTQKDLLQTGFNCLKKGGTLVYSTCSLEPGEDEAVVSYLLENNADAEIEEINLDIKRSDAVLEFEGQKYDERVSKCLRIWPQDNDTEGFFVAKIKKV